jgi:hypothetical protein
MRTEKQVSILGVVTLFIIVLTGCAETQNKTSVEKTRPDQEQQAKAVAQAEALQTVEGELTSVDVTTKTLSVKISEGPQMEFRYNDQTLITGADGGAEGLATKSGTPVGVNFDVATRTAIKIEVKQRQK